MTLPFGSVDWSDVAKQLGGILVRADLNAVVMRLDGGRAYRISDNVGEVNVTELVERGAIEGSVALPAAHFEAPACAMAHRLYAAMRGAAIDFTFGETWDGNGDASRATNGDESK